MKFLISDIYAQLPLHLARRYIEEKTGINIPFPSLRPVFRKKLFMKEGFDGVEALIGSAAKILDRDRNCIAKLKKTFRETSVFSAHASFEDQHQLMKDSEYNLVYDEESKLKENVAMLKFLTAWNRDAEKPILNIHLGKVNNTFARSTIEKKLEQCIELLKKTQEFAEANRCVIAVENLDVGKNSFYNLGSDPRDLEFLLKRAPKAKITYDPGHLDSFMYEEMKNKKDSEKIRFFTEYHNNFLNDFGDNIVYAHIYYNDIMFSNQIHDPYYNTGMHLPLTRISNDEFREAYSDIVRKILAAVERNCKAEGITACVNLEIPAGRIGLPFISNIVGIDMVKDGATVEEQLESLRMVKRIYYSAACKKDDDTRAINENGMDAINSGVAYARP